jgi:hypothetical protein
MSATYLVTFTVLLQTVALLALAALAVGECVSALRQLVCEGVRVALLDAHALRHNLLQDASQHSTAQHSAAHHITAHRVGQC